MDVENSSAGYTSTLPEHYVSSVGSSSGSRLDFDTVTRDERIRELEGRLAGLTEAAIISRSIGRQHLHMARLFISRARVARRVGKQTDFVSHCREARLAHQKARKCFAYARLCERRAESLADIAGVNFRSR